MQIKFKLENNKIIKSYKLNVIFKFLNKKYFVRLKSL